MSDVVQRPRRRGRPPGTRLSDETRARMSEASKRALADPEVRARMSEARKRAWATRRGYQIPAWVHAAGLAEDFAAVAAEQGEEAAASFCRALKREMEMAR